MIDERRAREVIRSGIEDVVALRQELGATQADAIIAASDVLVECFKRGGKVLICGNGGGGGGCQPQPLYNPQTGRRGRAVE